MPVALLGHWRSMQQVMECLVELVTLTISFGVVLSNLQFYNPLLSEQLLNERTFKVMSLFIVQTSGDTKLIKPPHHWPQCSSHWS